MIRVGAALVALMVNLASAALGAPRFIPSLESGDLIPPLPLVTQDGRPFTFADLRGTAVAVSFIYTRCRDPRMCPLVSAKFARAQGEIGSAPIRLVLVSLDPAYDSPAVLARYGRSLGADRRRFTLATAGADTIDELASRLGIATSVTAPGSIVHTDALVIIDPQGRIAQTIAGNDWSPDDLIDAARATLPRAGNAFIALRAWLAAASERCGQASAGLGSRALLVVAGVIFAAIGTAFWCAFRVTESSPSVPIGALRSTDFPTCRRAPRIDRRQTSAKEQTP